MFRYPKDHNWFYIRHYYGTAIAIVLWWSDLRPKWPILSGGPEQFACSALGPSSSYGWVQEPHPLLQ